jgi:hypothetical protein
MRIFISYSRKRRDKVETLGKDFHELGHEVWFDRGVTGGQAWWDRILESIRSCDVFALALTAEALDSQACMLEYQYASDLSKAILPVLMADGVSMALMPRSLSALQLVDYRKDDRSAAFALTKALENLSPSPPAPEPLPEPPEAPISDLSRLKGRIETRDTLTLEQQTALVFVLKQRLRKRAENADVRTLLARLRDRSDLLASVGEEIDSVLATQAPEPARESPLGGDFAPVAAPEKEAKPLADVLIGQWEIDVEADALYPGDEPLEYMMLTLNRNRTFRGELRAQKTYRSADKNTIVEGRWVTPDEETPQLEGHATTVWRSRGYSETCTFETTSEKFLWGRSIGGWKMTWTRLA